MVVFMTVFKFVCAAEIADAGSVYEPAAAEETQRVLTYDLTYPSIVDQLFADVLTPELRNLL